MNGQVARGLPDVGSPIAQYALEFLGIVMMILIFGVGIALLMSRGSTSLTPVSLPDNERRSRQLASYRGDDKRLGGTKLEPPTGFGAKVGSEVWMLRSYIVGCFGYPHRYARGQIFIQEVCECRDQFDARCSHAEIKHQAEVMVHAGFLERVGDEILGAYKLSNKGKRERRNERIATEIARGAWRQLVKSDAPVVVPAAWQEV